MPIAVAGNYGSPDRCATVFWRTQSGRKWLVTFEIGNFDLRNPREGLKPRIRYGAFAA